MGFMDRLNAAAGLVRPTEDAKRAVAEARKNTPRHIKALSPVGIANLCMELEQSLMPGEDVRFISSARGGAFAVTDKRIVYASSFGMEKRSLPIDRTLSAYIDRDLTEVNLRFTADGGRELKLSGVLMSPTQERKLREALPAGVMF